MTEQFEIQNRFTGAVQVTATIECAGDEGPTIKLGLAVIWAFKMGANLGYADLRGADLGGADLRGANLGDDKVKCIFARVPRNIEPHDFIAFELETGGYKIMAGCRWFTDAEYRTHIAAEYPDTGKAEETLAILDFIAGRARACGVIALNPVELVET